MEDLNAVMRERFDKTRQLEEAGTAAYPNGYPVANRIIEIIDRCAEKSAEDLEQAASPFTVAGRLVSIRSFGRSIFMHLLDADARVQLYFQQNRMGKEAFALVKKLDIGDIIRITGTPFRTKTGELTLLATEVVLLTKNLRPLPEKYHGLKDVELRYRQRYVDLIVNEEVRGIFRKRSRIIQAVREFLAARAFLEVETPMMQAVPGGAAAKPFKTHHNALDLDLYLRIAPELYLKRLLVGGFERVFELNRNFRNEGISTQHNPEFTMLEFYQAHATYEDLMTLTEEMFGSVAKLVNHGGLRLDYQGQLVDLTPPWRRLRLAEALTTIGRIPESAVSDPTATLEVAHGLGLEAENFEGHGKLLTKLFDLVVEPKLIQPTFITHYPLEVSPLSRKNEADPSLTDRFELFIAGREMANGFSELTDPREQRRRFQDTLERRRMAGCSVYPLPEAFLDALRHLDRAAGIALGIDRLVAIFTNAYDLDQVVAFPPHRD